MLVVRKRGRQSRDFGMFPVIIPADLLARPIDFIAVVANPVRHTINQLPDLQLNPALVFNLTRQLGERSTDVREGKRGTGDKGMPLRQRIDEGAVAAEVKARFQQPGFALHRKQARVATLLAEKTIGASLRKKLPPLSVCAGAFRPAWRY